MNIYSYIPYIFSSAAVEPIELQLLDVFDTEADLETIRIFLLSRDLRWKNIMNMKQRNDFRVMWEKHVEELRESERNLISDMAHKIRILGGASDAVN